jgi:hypothetical protein
MGGSRHVGTGSLQLVELLWVVPEKSGQVASISRAFYGWLAQLAKQAT